MNTERREDGVVPTQHERAAAYKRLLEAEPMPVEDWPAMKKEILGSHYAKLTKLLDEDE
jgi:hypothetical protein